MRRFRLARTSQLLALAVAASCAAPQRHPDAASPGANVAGKCPVMGVGADAVATPVAGAQPTAAGAMSTEDWWPNQLDLRGLHQNAPAGNPLGDMG